MLYFFFLCINMVIYMHHIYHESRSLCHKLYILHIHVIKCTYTWKALILVQKGFCVIFHAHTAHFDFEPIIKELYGKQEVSTDQNQHNQTNLCYGSPRAQYHAQYNTQDPSVAYGGWKLNIYKLNKYSISCDLTVKYLICKCLRCIF